MLKYFFDIKNGKKDIFKGLNIENEEEIMKLQGQYPTIYLSFKDEKYMSYDEFKEGITILISNLYREHSYLLESKKLEDIDKSIFKSVLGRKISITEATKALDNLMYYMNRHYGKKIGDFSNYTIDEASEEALNQIHDMKYRTELEERNINNILELAIVFKGKEIKVTKG